MDYAKGRLPNYEMSNASPALMETSVNQTWPVQQSIITTRLITPMTQLSTSPSATPLSRHDIPQEQLPSSSTPSPAPIFTQPRKSLPNGHDTEMFQQQPSRKRMKFQPDATLGHTVNNKSTKAKSAKGILGNQEGNDGDLETRTKFEQLHIMTSSDSEPQLSSTQNTLAPPKAIKVITPTIHIANKKRVAQTHAKLGTSIDDIFKIFKSVIDGTFNNLDFEISQQNFYEICSFACSTIPPKDVFTVISEALNNNIERIGLKMDSMASEKVNFLSAIILDWEQCLSMLVKINDLFNPLNSKYIIKETKYPSLFHYGKEIFVNTLSANIKIKTRTILSLTHLISCQRRQIHVGLTLITSTLNIIHKNLPIYTAEFGHELMKSTKTFYQKCASAGLQTLTKEDYVTFSLRLIVCEPTAIYQYHHYIPDDIKSPSLIALEELLLKHPDHIANCFKLTAEHGQKQVLKALYQLIRHHGGGISVLRIAFEQYILDECDMLFSDYKIDNQGKTIVDQPHYHVFVTGFLKLKAQFHSILSYCFDSNDTFRHSLRKCFEEAINRDQLVFAQHIASYMNHLLESIQVFSSTAHSLTLKALDQSIDLFRDLQAEDIFKCHYKAHLARRLLMNRSHAALTKETEMTERLQSECGVDFAKDLFAMINEMRMSQFRMSKFEELTSYLIGENHIHLNVSVLSVENWSIPLRKEELRLSSQMLTQQRYYNEFYRNENPRNKLTWMASFSTCVVNASYPNCAIQLHTTQYQAMILLLFNNLETTHWTVEKISKHTYIRIEDVKKSLEDLAGPEMQLLTRRRPSTDLAHNDMTDSDDFTYNHTFYTTETTIHLPNILKELPSASVKVMSKRELFNKQERLQASIMKVLKKHKSLDVMDIWELVKDSSKNGPRRLMVRLSAMENELQVLVQRCLIRNTMDDIYEYYEE